MLTAACSHQRETTQSKERRVLKEQIGEASFVDSREQIQVEVGKVCCATGAGEAPYLHLFSRRYTGPSFIHLFCYGNNFITLDPVSSVNQSL